MLKAVRTLAALLILAPVSAAQEPRLDSVAPAHRPLVKQRAMHCYRMPDGTIWDGNGYFEQRKILGYTLKAYDKLEQVAIDPCGTFVEDKVVDVIWKIKPTRDATAWRLTDYLGESEIPKGRFEEADRRTWLEAPPLWTCAENADYAWPFAYIDESDPDDYTRVVHKGYLEITRDWGDGRYEFKGYSLDRGRLEGIVHVPEPLKWIKKDRFKGAFFLWPTTLDEARGRAGQNYELVPAEDARVSADQLAAALLSGRARIIDWRFEMLGDKVLWHRSVRAIDRASPRVVADPLDRPLKPPPKPPVMPQGGPDLVILNDGRYFRGTIVRHDDKSIVIRTFVGQSEMEMTFKPDEVKEIQAPERR